MGNLSDAMQSIVDEIRSATEARRAALRQLMEDIGVRLSEIRSDTHNLTERFRREDSERKGAVGEMLVDFRKADNERKGAVGEMLGEFTSDRGQAHQIWAGRLKGKIKPEAVRKIKPKAVVEEAREKPVVEAAPPTEDKILEVIARHSEGIRLIDIGNELGVDWRILIGPSKSLVDAGQVEKIENMYYPKKEE